MVISVYNVDTGKYEDYAIDDFVKGNRYEEVPKYSLYKMLIKRIKFYSMQGNNTEFFITLNLIEFAANSDGVDNYNLLVDAINAFDRIVIIGDIKTDTSISKLLDIVSYWKTIKTISDNDELIKHLIEDFYNSDISNIITRLI